MITSVIIAVHEQPATLTWLLTSLGEQDYDGAWEILVCDDGSSGDVLAAVRDAHRAHPCDLRYVWQPHEGFRAGRSRNNGVRAARGGLLVFIDGDQVVEPDFLSRHVAAHRGHRRLVAGAVKRVPADPTIRTHIEARADARRREGCLPERQEAWARSASPWMCCLGANLSCARDPELRFDEHFVGWGGEDRELAYRLAERCSYDVYYEPAAISYHIGASGMTAVLQHHRGIVQLLRNRLHLRALYPTGDLAPAFELVRLCHLDRITDTWYGAAPDGRRLDAILDEAMDWMTRHGVTTSA